MPRRRILASIPTGNGYCRDLVRGVFLAARRLPDWTVEHREPYQLPDPADWDGIIALDPPDAWGPDPGRPLVDLSNRRLRPGGHAVTSDDRAAGILAAEHLLGLGHRRFAFAGLRDCLYSERRGEGFRVRLAAAGCVPAEHVLYQGERTPDGSWISHPQVTRAWLRGLPRPCALFACSDSEAVAIQHLARQEGLRIPDDLALMGVDDDDLVCDLAQVPISSVRMDPRRNGVLAVERLESLLAGRRTPSLTLLPPRGVAVRASTDAAPVEDTVVREAIAWMRVQALEPVTATDAARQAGLSLRALQLRFARAVGQGPAEILSGLRLDHGARLLRESDWPVRRIAAVCGFAGPAAFTTAFGRRFGAPPGRWRGAAGGPST